MSTEAETPVAPLDLFDMILQEYAGKRPASLDAAITRLYALEADFARLVVDANDAAYSWAECDLIKARVKNQSVEKLVTGGMSRSAAEKAASDHEDYTAHRDKLAKLETDKRDAEAARDLVAQLLYNTREVVKAFVQFEPRKRVTVSTALDDPYENPTPIRGGGVERERPVRSRYAKSELPKVPRDYTVPIAESKLLKLVVTENAGGYVIDAQRVEVESSLPALTFVTRGLKPGILRAGRVVPDKLLMILRSEIDDEPGVDRFVEYHAEHISGYSEIVRLPITARVCFVCENAGGLIPVNGEYVCAECDVSAQDAAIDAERATPV